MSKATVYVTVSGLTGSGKSAVMGEIEIALKAIGIPVEHDAEFQSEKNMTHADWQDALDLYKPVVVLKEVNTRPSALEKEYAEDGPCCEADGCPTEKAVLQRFWRQHHSPTTPS